MSIVEDDAPSGAQGITQAVVRRFGAKHEGLNAPLRLAALLAATFVCLGWAAPSPASAAVTYSQIYRWQTAKCLDVAGASQAIGARVQQWTCNGTPAQKWTRMFTDSGYFMLKVAVSGQCLDVKDASLADNAPVVQKPCTGAYNQQWIERTSGLPGFPFLLARHSGKVLRILSESTGEGAQAVQYQIVPDGPTSVHGSDWQFQSAVTYSQVRNWHSAKCLDLAEASQAIGARVHQWSCNGNVAQQWRKEFTDSGYFRLRAAASDQCLEVKAASQADNAPVVQRPCTGSYNQQWIARTSGVPGWPFLVARHSGKGLTFLSESLLNGAQAVQHALGSDGPGTLHAGDWQFQ